MKTTLLVLGVIFLLATGSFFVIRGQKSMETPLSKHELLVTVEKLLNPNLFEAAPCLKIDLNDKEVKCFASHLTHREAIEIIAKAMESLVVDWKQPWNRPGSIWFVHYPYRLNKKMTISFNAAELDWNDNIPKENSFYKDFSTYIDLKIYEEQ